MKIVTSIGKLYNSQLDINRLLSKQVEQNIISFKLPQWHYTQRLKSLESFALKLETGRVKDPKNLEDFFACTIVVENISSIKLAKKEIKKFFKVIEERPKNIDFTNKDSSSFIFDDLRIYATLKPTSARKPGPINQIQFEIQIKTFLQHAWAIATHDLVYKSDEISWIKQRVAYQVKAMLENAEVSIEKAENVKKLPGIPVSNFVVTFQNEIKQFILKNWEIHNLPKDMVRLIKNIESFIKMFDFKLDDLQIILDKETQLGKGILTLNLSPYLIILQSVINQEAKRVNRFLIKDFKGKYKPHIFLPSELDLTKIETNLNSSQLIKT